MPRVLVLLTLGVLLVPEAARSQDSATAPAPPATRPHNAMPGDSLAAGMRIRLVEWGIPFRRAGYLYAVNGDTLVFRMDKNFQSLRLKAGNILELSVYDGRGRTRTRMLAGAGIGVLAGLVAGVGLQQMRDEPDRSQAEVGMVIGGAAGVLVGSLTPGERWRPVWLH